MIADAANGRRQGTEFELAHSWPGTRRDRHRSRTLVGPARSTTHGHPYGAGPAAHGGSHCWLLDSRLAVIASSCSRS